MTITSQSYQLDPDTREWVFEDGRRIPVFAGSDDGEAAPAPTTPEGKPEGEGDPGQPQEGKPPTQPGKAKEKGAAPWAKDLEAMRQAEDPFTAFDEYLRSTVQPRMTQHEQQVAEFTKMFGDVDTAKLVSQLMADLEANPKDTLKQLMGGFEVDPMDLLDDPEGDPGTDPNDPTGEPEGDPDDPRLQYVQQLMEQEKQDKQDKALNDLLDGIENEMPGFNRELYVRILKANDGDAQAALEDYAQFHQPPATPDDPPPVGGGDRKGVTPREAPPRRSISEALSGFFRDQEAAAKA